MGIPAFQVEDIEQLVGHRYFRQAVEYARSGAVVDTRRQGYVISAGCVGSSRTPYQVESKFDDKGLVESRCTCPVGSSGQCKHVAALLLSWVESPQSFTEVEPWDAALGRCQRRELIEIILRLIERRPDLERIIELMLPKADAEVMEVDPASFERRVAEALASLADKPDTGIRAVEQLRAVKDSGDQFIKQHESATAAAAYESIIHGLLEHAQQLDYRQPDLLDLLYECVEGLSVCLFHLNDQPEPRQPILRTLLDLYRFDVVHGGVSLNVDLSRLLLAHVTKDERALLADWIRAALPAVNSSAGRRMLGGLLLELLGRQIEESELFDVCRRTDRFFDLVRRLMRSDRMAEALEEARKADDDELLRIADLLVRHRAGDAAQRLVEQRAAQAPHPRLAQWIEQYQTRHRGLQTMLDLYQQLFRVQPDFAAYQRLRSLARQMGCWDSLRADLLRFIEESVHNRPLLVRIHLEENDIDHALELVTPDQADDADDGLAIRVAKAAERSRPVEALELYRLIAERLIARRGRDNFTEAGRHLRKVRKLMKRSGKGGEWQKYLDDLRRRHRPLRAIYEDLESVAPDIDADGEA